MKEVGLVSVVIPCYNQSHFLGEAIKSVKRQTYKSYEIIVINDGSTDDTNSITKKFHDVRLIQQDNMGLAAARNAGLREAHGEFVVFLDSDDRLLPHALETGVSSLKARADCAFVSGFCNIITFNGDSVRTFHPQVDKSDYYLSLIRKCYIWSPSSVMYRLSVFKEVSGFDTSVNSTADYELYLRIARRFPVHHHGEIVSEYRQHEANMSSDHRLMLKNVLYVLESQSEYVKANPRYKEAWHQGIAFYKQFYRERIGAQVITSMKNRQWKKAIHEGLSLVIYPNVLLKYFKRKVSNLLKRKNYSTANGFWF